MTTGFDETARKIAETTDCDLYAFIVNLPPAAAKELMERVMAYGAKCAARAHRPEATS